jgi:hypothetical protein
MPVIGSTCCINKEFLCLRNNRVDHTTEEADGRMQIYIGPLNAHSIDWAGEKTLLSVN